MTSGEREVSVITSIRPSGRMLTSEGDGSHRLDAVLVGNFLQHFRVLALNLGLLVAALTAHLLAGFEARLELLLREQATASDGVPRSEGEAELASHRDAVYPGESTQEATFAGLGTSHLALEVADHTVPAAWEKENRVSSGRTDVRIRIRHTLVDDERRLAVVNGVLVGRGDDPSRRVYW